MKCKVCGAEIAPKETVCTQCGNSCVSGLRTKIEKLLQLQKRPFVFAMLLFGVIVFSGLFVYLFASSVLPVFSKEEPKTVHPVSVTDTTQPMLPEENVTPFKALQENSYDSALYYSRMNTEIHKSQPADKETFVALEAEIRNFNSACADYMNDVTETPPPQLAANSAAYRSQTGYKKEKPDMRQFYESVYVSEVRVGEKDAFVWAEETVRIFENGEETAQTNRWVYRLQKEENNWKIIDFTKDPRDK